VGQTSQLLISLGGADVLLNQYRHNLEDWRQSVKHQYDAALAALGIRAGILLAMLAVVFAGSKLWGRLIARYAEGPQSYRQLLRVRTITAWILAIAIVFLTPATVLGSFATFAGLIAAGVAVAMQGVLLSIVGYFLLIGRHGVGVGDRVQIGTVVGEVVNLGLVRMQLLELSSQAPFGATGRTITFANSVVFQAGGLLKQVPGMNFAWHQTKATLPPGSDSAKLKEQLLLAVKEVVGGYQQDIVGQATQIGQLSKSDLIVDAGPQVQLQFAGAGIEALVRYPVPLQHAADIDDRVFEALLQVICKPSGESDARTSGSH
jgi:small-conductance mechanosensitive channel